MTTGSVIPERGAGIRVGVCNKNPLSLSSSLLAGNDERTGLLAKELPAFEKGEQMAVSYTPTFSSILSALKEFIPRRDA